MGVLLGAAGAGILMVLMRIPERLDTLLLVSTAIANLISGLSRLSIGVLQLTGVMVVVLVTLFALMLLVGGACVCCGRWPLVLARHPDPQAGASAVQPLDPEPCQLPRRPEKGRQDQPVEPGWALAAGIGHDGVAQQGDQAILPGPGTNPLLPRGEGPFVWGTAANGNREALLRLPVSNGQGAKRLGSKYSLECWS
jgi:hypothetical protein